MSEAPVTRVTGAPARAGHPVVIENRAQHGRFELTGKNMDTQQTDAWLDAVAQPGPMMLSGAPISGDLDIGGERSISGGSVSGDAVEQERAFFKSMRARFNGKVDPATMNESDLEEYLNAIKDHPSVGIASIARMSQRKAGWSPTPGSAKNTPDKFATYLDILGTAPLMRLKGSHHQEVTYSEKNYQDLIDTLVDAIQAIIGGDKDEIAGSLRNLAVLGTSQTKKESSDTLFAQNNISLGVDRIGYNVFLTRATVSKEETGKSHIFESTLSLYSLTLEFDSDDWKLGRYRQIGRRIYSDDDDWLDDVETEEGADRVKLCIEAS